MTRTTALHVVCRFLWGLPGGLAVAHLAFMGYLMQPGLNHDTAVHGVVGLALAAVGLLVGVVLGGLVGAVLNRWLVGHLPGRVAWAHLASCVLSALLWWGVWSVGHHGVLPWWLTTHAPVSVGRAGLNKSVPEPAHMGICRQTPPTDARQRRSWNEECR